MRWKELVQTYQPPVEPDVPESVPVYLRECQSCNTNHDQTNAERSREQEVSLVGEDQLVFLSLTAKVCLAFQLKFLKMF